MKRIALVLVAVNLALCLWASAAPGQFPFTEQQLGDMKAEQDGMCPDGGTMSLKMYMPEEGTYIFVFSRGNVAVAIRESKGGTDRVYVMAEGRWYTIEETRAKYPSPCDIPFTGQP